MGDLSPHFNRSEFDCHDGTRAHPDPELVDRLELLRAQAGGRPLRIVSGYRSPTWNAHVHGARHSQHLYNRAADIPSGYATIDQALKAGFTGIGFCGRWAVHLDVREVAKPVVFADC